LKWFYTKEHPNNLPPLKKMRVKGKDIWDDSLTTEFLERMVKVEILPKILSNMSKQIIAKDKNNDGLPF
jgi:hypothetical protein